MANFQKKRVAKPSPRISVNKLAEFITTTSPSKRTNIVKNQKYPKKPVITRYNAARSTIVNYFIHGKGDRRIVEQKIQELLKQSYESKFRNSDNQLSIEALSIFRRSKHPLDLSGFSEVRRAKKGDKLRVNGVDVSISPDVIFTGRIRGKRFVGAIKLYIVKKNPLSKDSGMYVCTLLRHSLEEQYGAECVSPEFCVLFDIFTGNYFIAPKAFKSLRREIEAACDQISAIWDKV